MVNTAYAKYHHSKKNQMPRPQIYPIKKVIGFEQEQLNAIDQWRRRQTPIPTVSEAIRRLVELGLASKGGKTKS
jgi:hypothetical protein